MTGFRRLYDARFLMQRLQTVEQDGSDDDRRTVAGGSGWSEHVRTLKDDRHFSTSGR